MAARIYKEEKGKNKGKRKRIWMRDIILNRETKGLSAVLVAKNTEIELIRIDRERHKTQEDECPIDELQNKLY